LALALLAGVGRKAWAANTPAEATVTVTPIPNVSLTIDPTTYAFGTIDTSSHAVAVSSLTLVNTGEVDLASITKEISAQSAPPGWTAGDAAGPNAYVLYVASAAAMPVEANFTATHRFGAQGVQTDLTGLSDATTALPMTAGSNYADLWFRLDVPTSVANTLAREITVLFTGVAAIN